jgi:hypothetical protein
MYVIGAEFVVIVSVNFRLEPSSTSFMYSLVTTDQFPFSLTSFQHVFNRRTRNFQSQKLLSVLAHENVVPLSINCRGWE